MADVYGTAAGFKAYWLDRGNSVLATMNDADIAAPLLNASEWIDGIYGASFDGLKLNGRAQVREWPRSDVVDNDGYSVPSDAVPREVVEATYEVAGKVITSPGVLFKDYTPSKYSSVSISGAISVDYARGTAADFQTEFPSVAAKLRTLMGDGRGNFSALSGGSSRV